MLNSVTWYWSDYRERIAVIAHKQETIKSVKDVVDQNYTITIQKC